MITEGDRVVFVSNENGYSLGSNNPMVGTPFECEGTVAMAAGSSYRVIWDNGCTNSYRTGDLELAKGYVGDPNRLFLMKKLKKGKIRR